MKLTSPLELQPPASPASPAQLPPPPSSLPLHPLLLTRLAGCRSLAGSIQRGFLWGGCRPPRLGGRGEGRRAHQGVQQPHHQQEEAESMGQKGARRWHDAQGFTCPGGWWWQEVGDQGVSAASALLQAIRVHGEAAGGCWRDCMVQSQAGERSSSNSSTPQSMLSASSQTEKQKAPPNRLTSPASPPCSPRPPPSALMELPAQPGWDLTLEQPVGQTGANEWWPLSGWQRSGRWTAAESPRQSSPSNTLSL